MEKNNSFNVNPTHATPVGFWHDICRGCSYENSFDGREYDSYRVRECIACLNNTLRYYQSRKPVNVSKDGNGRHIIKSYE